MRLVIALMLVSFGLSVQAASPLTNSSSALTIPTYDGSGQAIHPDVLYFADGWNGHKYWMAMTPYPGSDDDYENPSIVVSSNGISWVVPDGLTNPLTNKPTGTGFNSDPDLVYNDDTDSLWLYYRKYDQDVDNYLYLMLMTSTNGVNWTAATNLLSWNMSVTTPERSASVLKQGASWHMWAQYDPELLKYRASSDGITWSSPTNCTAAPTQTPWHINVIYDSARAEYIMLLNDESSALGSIYYMRSTDRINWTNYTTAAIALPVSGWSAGGLYRPAMVLDGDNFSVWYSAFDKSTPKVWGTGLTGCSYAALRTFLGITDPDPEPPTSGGTATAITVNIGTITRR